MPGWLNLAVAWVIARLQRLLWWLGDRRDGSDV